MKNPAAVALGKLGGHKGGIARAKNLTPAQRSDIARNAARKRWSKDGIIQSMRKQITCPRCKGSGVVDVNVRDQASNIKMGQHYARERIKHGIPTQAAMAQMIGCSDSTLCMLEQGKRGWSNKWINAYEEVFKAIREQEQS